MGRPIPEHDPSVAAFDDHRSYYGSCNLLPFVSFVQLAAVCFANHHGAPICFYRRHCGAVPKRRISVGTGFGRIHRVMGNCRVEWGGSGFLHPQLAAGRHGAEGSHYHRRETKTAPRDDDSNGGCARAGSFPVCEGTGVGDSATAGNRGDWGPGYIDIIDAACSADTLRHFEGRNPEMYVPEEEHALQNA